MVSLNDLADRPPRPLADGEVIDLGGKRVRHIDTPARARTRGKRGCSTRRRPGRCCAATCSPTSATPRPLTTDDIVEPAMEAEAMFRSTSLAPDTPLVMSRLGRLRPTTLALMHGASYNGDCGQALLDLANAYDERYLARV